MASPQQPSSVRRTIGIATLIMMGSVFLSRVLAVVRDMVLAAYGGTSAEMDAYVASFLMPEIINHLLAGGFMSITFIPIFQKHAVAGQPERSWRVFSNLICTGTVAMVVLTALCMLFTGQILALTGMRAGQASPQTLALTVKMTRIVLPAQIFFYWGALLMAVQYASGTAKQFIGPALAPLVYNLGIIVGGVVLSPVMGIQGFAWGVFGGALLGQVVIQLIGARKAGMRFSFLIDLKDRDLRTYVLITLPLVAGLGMQFSNEVLFRYFGSFMGTGGLASLNFSLRIMMSLVAIFGFSAGVAVFPFLSRYAAEKKFDEMNRLTYSMLVRVGAFMIPLSLLMLALSSEAVAILYQRGRFTEASTLLTAPVLAMYCIGAAAFAANTLIVRSFYALQNTVLPMVVSTIVILAGIPFYFVLSKTLGARGVALMASVLALVQCGVLVGIWSRRYSGGREVAGLLVTIAKLVLIGAAGALLCHVIAHGLSTVATVKALHTLPRNLVIAACGGVPATVAMYFAIDRLGIMDVRSALRRLAGRRGSA